MLFKYTAFTSLILLGLVACKSEEKPSIVATEIKTPTLEDQKQMQEKLQCFGMYNYDRQELATVIIEGDTIYGDLRGIINAEDINFNGTIKGNCKGDTCHVKVTKNYDLTYTAETLEQIWVRNAKEEFEVIKGMEYENRTAEKFYFRPIRCFKFDPKAKYDAILEMKGGYAPIIQNEVMGIMDSNYNLVIKPNYEYISHISEGTVAFQEQGQNVMFFGIMDIKENIIVPPTKSYATPFYDGIALVSDEKGYYFVDKKGQIAIAPNGYKSVISGLDYEKLTPFIREGLIPINKDDKWGYLDKKGKVVIPFIYEFVEHFKDGKATVQKDGKTIVIDRYNKCLFNCD